jgi:hypothetical protein
MKFINEIFILQIKEESSLKLLAMILFLEEKLIDGMGHKLLSSLQNSFLSAQIEILLGVVKVVSLIQLSHQQIHQPKALVYNSDEILLEPFVFLR